MSTKVGQKVLPLILLGSILFLLSLANLFQNILPILWSNPYLSYGLLLTGLVLLTLGINTTNREVNANLINIAEKVDAQKKLKYQSHLLENIQEGIAAVDLEGNLLFANQQAQLLFGLSENAAASDGPPHRQVSELFCSWIKTQRWQGEFPFSLDDERHYFMYHIHPLGENGSATGYVVIISDITELVKTREQAEAANLAKSQFLANMSHEIRTPMIGILGCVELLEQSELFPQQAESLAVIRACGEQLLEIINQILDVSKIEIGGISLQIEPCNLTELLSQTTYMVEPILRAKGLSLHLSIDRNLPGYILADAAKVRQVLLNLLYNAIKFTQLGGIQIRAYPGEYGYLNIAVADTGVGVPTSQVNRIFDPFTQVDSSASREYGGTGLGLYICKKLVELMGGSIWHEHRDDTFGSVFTFCIGLKVPAESDFQEQRYKEEKASEAGDLLIGFNPVSVLVVEDNELNRKIISQMLINYGFDVSTCINGLECLQVLQSKRFDVILMDIQMPVMDGYETTSLIRQMPETRDMPVIAITAHAMAGDREKCLACGCNAYLAKPFKAEQLVQEIKHHLKKTSPLHLEKKSLPREVIDDLLPEFMNLLQEMVIDLNRSAEVNDISSLASISHDIKGTAGMYGFLDISAVAAELQEAALANSHSRIAQLCQSLNDMVTQAHAQIV